MSNSGNPVQPNPPVPMTHEEAKKDPVSHFAFHLNNLTNMMPSIEQSVNGMVKSGKEIPDESLPEKFTDILYIASGLLSILQKLRGM